MVVCTFVHVQAGYEQGTADAIALHATRGVERSSNPADSWLAQGRCNSQSSNRWPEACPVLSCTALPARKHCCTHVVCEQLRYRSLQAVLHSPKRASPTQTTLSLPASALTVGCLLLELFNLAGLRRTTGFWLEPFRVTRTCERAAPSCISLPNVRQL